MAAAATFRDGDFLCDLAAILVDVAEQQRLCGDLDSSGRVCNEAIEIAGPRELVPAHSAALAVRARVRADIYIDTDPTGLYVARDDADHAFRLATRVRQLPWQRLDALRAHAHIDRIEGADHGWADLAAKHHATLVPDDLDRDVLVTVETKASMQASD
jgi:hypothetical protein